VAALIAAAVALLLALTSVGAAAQARAPIFLEPGHWSYDALRRLHVAGGAPNMSDPAVAPVTLRHVRAALDSAASRFAAQGRQDLAGQAAAYVRMLERETGHPGAEWRARIRGGWTAAAGEALAGAGYYFDQDWQGAQPIRGASGPGAAMSASGHVTPRLAWSLDGGYLAEEWRLASATAAAALGPLDAWAGRRRLHYGVGRGGAMVIGTGINEVPDVAFRTTYDFDGIGLQVREPFRFPWILDFLGETRIEIVGGRLTRKGQVENPYVIFGRFMTSPFSPRLTLGVNRGAIFGGDGIPITAGRLAGLLIGLHGGNVGEFENQVFSAIARYRPPLGPLPLEAYVEVGMDDTSGAIKNMPTYLAGVDVGPFPTLPALSLGVEHVRFPESCCGNPIWYRSVFYRGSWSDEGRFIAHPVGGHGTEWLVHGRLDMPQQGVLLRLDGFRRERGRENLLAPERAGRSTGASLGVELRTTAGGALRIDGVAERGNGWNLHRYSVMLSQPLLPQRQ
jgi:hypothetical protein